MQRSETTRFTRLGRKGWSLVWRRATASWRALPNVFILGATKAGSTTLTYMLWQHPAHVPALAKELMYLQKLPNFLSNHETDPLTALLWGGFKNGHARFSTAGYRKFFPLQLAMERRRRRVGRAITSDCDPFNLYCDVAMRRIAEMNVEPRFIVSLRDPVARAYSDYNMHRVRAAERRSFAQAISQELGGGERRFRKRFVRQGMYASDLKRWFAAFSRQRFLVVRAEDLFHDGTAVANVMFDFLGLERVRVESRRLNAGRYDAEIDAATRFELKRYFRPHNEELYELLGRDMGWD